MNHTGTPRVPAIAAVAVLMFACAGCGSESKRPPVAKVHGKVELDGKPVEGGSVVTSVASGRGAQGSIKGGQFELSTYGTDDGALLGSHKIAVIVREKGEEGPEGKAGKLLIPERYINPETSGLTIEVQEGDNSPELKLTSP